MLVLLPGFVSVVPVGGATVAVFVNVAGPFGAVPVMVIVAVPLGGNVVIEPFTVLPVAETGPHARHWSRNHTWTETNVTPTGSGSLNVLPSAELGPALPINNVYVIVPPATTEGVADFWIDTSALAPSASISVAELLPGVGSVTPAGAVTVAVLINEPVALALMVVLTV